LYKIKNLRAGIYGALLYTACVYTSIISGLFILPDSPQVIFWVISIYLLMKCFILKENSNLNILLFGISVGLCTLCKIHGLYLWFAAVIYILFFERKWLFNKNLWFSFLITLLLISPIFYWNYKNDFITYSYHSQRIVANSGMHISSFFTELTGEILYANPVNFALIIIVIFVCLQRKLFVENKKLFILLLLLGLPLIFIFWIVSLFRDTLPHWPGPGYIALLILAAYYSDQVFKNKKKTFKIIYAANALLIVVLITGYLLIDYLPTQLGSKDMQTLGSNDFTLDLFGWENFETKFKALIASDIADKKMMDSSVLLSNKWFPAAHINYYLAYPLHMKLYAFGPLFDIHNFAWLNQINGQIKQGTDAYYIAPSNYFSDPTKSFSNNFKIIETSVIVPQYRSGKEVRCFYVYRMKCYVGGLSFSIPKN
jgi:4-amino-4-deoxy-L-arabinose transferase-like glycosyltransferase